MRVLKRNKRPFYYCLYKEDRRMIDEYGNESGENIVVYQNPVEMYANVSPATGQSNTEQFGNLENYDKGIVTDDLECPISESSVLFIDKQPEFKRVLTHRTTAATTIDEYVRVPVPDYTVLRVAKSINSISIAARKVKVS